ncbi:unnamed protein product [Ectocarpus sp. CCAP 1310/34]|nr:unnamed protein product [Ectocarpus sp. CCAP 1310/34]
MTAADKGEESAPRGARTRRLPLSFKVDDTGDRCSAAAVDVCVCVEFVPG